MPPIEKYTFDLGREVLHFLMDLSSVLAINPEKLIKRKFESLDFIGSEIPRGYYKKGGCKGMKKVLIFGTGSTGRRIFKELNETSKVIGFLDNDQTKWGKDIDDIPILGNGNDLENVDYDEIVVCSLTGMNAIQKQLMSIGIPSNKINCEHISTQVNARINFLQDLAELNENKLDETIAVAEGGVFQGDFAKEINKFFPNNTLYLFDTFEGFDERDTEKEHKEGFSIFEKNHLNITSESMVLDKMSHPKNVEIRKGYFPESLVGIEHNSFYFVNLDFDLYNPTIDGLRFFYPRLIKDGVLLIHDYYNPGYTGIKAAIDDYEKEIGQKLRRLPIGDHCSIALIK